MATRCVSSFVNVLVGPAFANVYPLREWRQGVVLKKVVHRVVGASRGRKQSNNPRLGSLPLPGDLSFGFWNEIVNQRKPVSSAEGCDPGSQETSGEKETA
jgi:hypothetical protein